MQPSTALERITNTAISTVFVPQTCRTYTWPVCITLALIFVRVFSYIGYLLVHSMTTGFRWTPWLALHQHLRRPSKSV